MLSSFKIRCFRTFRELTIDRLAQVNLVVGQNNVGKTTVLEALWLYANGARSDAIYRLLVSRDEIVADEDVDSRESEVDIASLFHGRVLAPDQDISISLGEATLPFNKVKICLRGILEHFLAFLIPPEDRAIAHVDRFLNGIAVEERLFPEPRLAKARIHAWLAIQNEPGKPLGQSITARYLDANAEVVQPFINWIRAVLVD